MSITLKDYSLIQTLDESIGERVHIWLRRRGLMQRDLAAVLGISPAAVSHKIAGRSSWSALDLVKASTLLQLPLGELISDEMIEIEQKKLVSGSSEPETNSSHLRESNSRPSHYE